MDRKDPRCHVGHCLFSIDGTVDIIFPIITYHSESSSALWRGTPWLGESCFIPCWVLPHGPNILAYNLCFSSPSMPKAAPSQEQFRRHSSSTEQKHVLGLVAIYWMQTDISWAFWNTNATQTTAGKVLSSFRVKLQRELYQTQEMKWHRQRGTYVSKERREKKKQWMEEKRRRKSRMVSIRAFFHPLF